MSYEPPVNFDSIEGALDYLKTELQGRVDKNNDMVLSSEKQWAQAELLSKQESDLREKVSELTRSITALESKREDIKHELKEYAKKTTDRLDKERADFEAVRIKKREELVKVENDLDTREEQLNQLQLSLKAQESGLEERQKQLEEIGQSVIGQQNGFDRQQAAIDKAKSDHADQVSKDTADTAKQKQELEQEKLVLRNELANLEKKKAHLKDSEDEADTYHKQARDVLLSAESRMSKIEAIDKQQKERENRLNLREASLMELDKTLTAKKIQLEDRQATMQSHS